MIDDGVHLGTYRLHLVAARGGSAAPINRSQGQGLGPRRGGDHVNHVGVTISSQEAGNLRVQVMAGGGQLHVLEHRRQNPSHTVINRVGVTHHHQLPRARQSRHHLA